MRESRNLPTKSEPIGLWLIGASGRVGSAVALGVAALRRKLIASTGSVSGLPAFRSVSLVDPGRFVIGGHEIRRETVLEAVRTAHRSANIFDENLIRRCQPDLRAVQRNLRLGTLFGAGRAIRRLADGPAAPREKSAARTVERLSADILGFRDRHRLREVVVVHVASTEPPFARQPAYATWAKLERALARPGDSVLPTSSLYALAAIEAGCPYINFTPSTGIAVPALRERAEDRGLPYMGRDGKTGETLIKSALAPMFAMRNLNVLSWVGQNILGNRDGLVLDDPPTKRAKIASKDRVVSRIVSGNPTTRVWIDYVPSLDDWKVAWDFIHFEGFLGAKMSLQFTWTGCDSLLAAPLILDLARFAELEHRRGRAGPMKHLGFFFKDPMDVDDHDLPTQWQRLLENLGST